MTRIKPAVTAHHRHKKTLARAKGYSQGRRKLIRIANETVMKGLAYAYRDRRARKGDMRRLWIQRINAAVRRVLGVPIGDLTSGFRAVSAEVFIAVSIEENGFGIQLEGTVKAYRAGFRVAEVPITLGVRKNGYSKMAYTRSFWLGYARLVVRLWLKRRMLDSPVRTFYAEVEDP